jgi:hypothetical protein
LETKSGKEGIENFIGNKGEVIASSKKQIENGGTAVVAIKNHKYDPIYQKTFRNPLTSQSRKSNLKNQANQANSSS